MDEVGDDPTVDAVADYREVEDYKERLAELLDEFDDVSLDGTEPVRDRRNINLILD